MTQSLSSPRRRLARLLLAAAGALVLAGVVYGALVQRGLLPTPLQPEPAPAPPPAPTRDGRWRQDIAYLAAELPRLHRDAFFRTPAETFRAQAAALEAQVPQSSDLEIALGLASLAALIGDGHTSVEFADPERFRTFPLRLMWFGDDLVVVGARPEYRDALGTRVTHIGDTPVDAALDAVTPFIAHDNAQNLRALSPRFLLTPEILAAAGVLPDVPVGRFQLETAGGERLAVELEPVRADRPFEELTLYDTGAVRLPLRMEAGDRNYWYTYLPEERALYLHYRRCADDPERPFVAFNQELFALIDSQPVERVIVDLRFNGGGDSRILQPFIGAIRQRPELNQQGRLYVLLGAQTYSSALMNAIELRDRTSSILLGEPTGGRPNHYGEVRSFRLPNSGLRVMYSTRLFTMLPGSDAPSLEPDLPYPITWADLLAGADPALEAALAGVLPPTMQR